MSTSLDFSAMSLDDLWHLHEKISKLLVARLTAQQRLLDAQLAVVQRRLSAPSAGADDPSSDNDLTTTAAGKPVRKPGSRAAKHMTSQV